MFLYFMIGCMWYVCDVCLLFYYCIFWTLIGLNLDSIESVNTEILITQQNNSLLVN